MGFGAALNLFGFWCAVPKVSFGSFGEFGTCFFGGQLIVMTRLDTTLTLFGWTLICTAILWNLYTQVVPRKAVAEVQK